MHGGDGVRIERRATQRRERGLTSSAGPPEGRRDNFRRNKRCKKR
jgi:hypothetical protein